MTASTSLIHHLAGEPDPVASMAKLLTDTPGVCTICARRVPRTADAGKALGTNFTDRSMYRATTSLVCPACLWCCSGKPPATLRMWTVVAVPGQTLPASNPKAWLQDTPGLYLGARGDTTGALVDSILTAPPAGPWHVSVAVSGQKHVVPYSDINHGGGRWAVRVETVTVTGTPDEWVHVRGHALALRRLGVPADDVLTGTPRYLKTPADLAAWRSHSHQLVPWLGSPMLHLALWTITKGALDDHPDC
jgi:hypothetical protein